MGNREVRRLGRELDEVLGKIPRSDRIYQDQAEKMRAYRHRRKNREMSQATVNALLDAANAAARVGDATASLFLTSKEPDIFKRLTAVFEERTRQRQRQAEKDRKMVEQLGEFIVQSLTGKPKEQPTVQQEPYAPGEQVSA